MVGDPVFPNQAHGRPHYIVAFIGIGLFLTGLVYHSSLKNRVGAIMCALGAFLLTRLEVIGLNDFCLRRFFDIEYRRRVHLDNASVFVPQRVTRAFVPLTDA